MKTVEELAKEFSDAHKEKRCGGPEECPLCAADLFNEEGLKRNPLLRLLKGGKP